MIVIIIIISCISALYFHTLSTIAQNGSSSVDFIWAAMAGYSKHKATQCVF